MVSRTGSSYDLQTILDSPKYMDPAKVIDRLERYQRVLGNRGPWDRIDFNGRTVLEIGCGPLLGWAPVAIYLGCEKYVGVEPGADGSIARSEHVWAAYFKNVHRQLRAYYGERMNLSEFRERLLSATVFQQPLEETDWDDEVFDIVLSNSTLEHVFDIEPFFRTLASVSSDDTVHLHAVDFGNHLRKDSPFAGLYDAPRPEGHSHRGINLVKPSEFLELFRNVGIDIELVPYYSVEGLLDQQIAPFWRRFEMEDLALKVGFFIRAGERE